MRLVLLWLLERSDTSVEALGQLRSAFQAGGTVTMCIGTGMGAAGIFEAV